MTDDAMTARFADQHRLKENVRMLEVPLAKEQQRLHGNNVRLLLDIMRQPNTDGNRTMLPVPRDFWHNAAYRPERRWVPFVSTMGPMWRRLLNVGPIYTRQQWQAMLLETVGASKEKDGLPTKAFVLVKEAELEKALAATVGSEPLENRFNFRTLEVEAEEWPLVRHFRYDKYEGWGVYFCPFQRCARESYHWMTDSLQEAQGIAMEISVRIQAAAEAGVPYTIPGGYLSLPRYISPEDLFFKL